MDREKTTAQVSNELNKKDTTKYDSIEVGVAQKDTIPEQLQIAIERGLKDFDDDEFAVVMHYKTDPRLVNVMKRIFYPTPFLPKPVPDQAVWVFNRHKDKLTFMWSLPEPYACAYLSTMNNINKKFERTALWSRLFFENKLIKKRREDTGVNLETEHEYLNLNREKLAEAFNNNREALLAESSNSA